LTADFRSPLRDIQVAIDASDDVAAGQQLPVVVATRYASE
jgi:hypothetical protein